MRAAKGWEEESIDTFFLMVALWNRLDRVRVMDRVEQLASLYFIFNFSSIHGFQIHVIGLL